MIYKQGNIFLTDLTNCILPHQTNNLGLMGAGFVVPLLKKFPKACQVYLDTFDQYKLGDVIFVEEKSTVIAHMFGQNGLIGKNNPHPTDYTALRKCLQQVAKYAKKTGLPIKTIKFSCGLGGASWDVVESIIKDEWKDLDVTIYILE